MHVPVSPLMPAGAKLQSMAMEGEKPGALGHLLRAAEKPRPPGTRRSLLQKQRQFLPVLEPVGD